MQAVKLWHTRVRRALPTIHATRLASVFAALGGLLKGRQLWSSGVGRHLPTQVAEKHNIKRVDRLLGNGQLHAELPALYRWLSSLLLSPDSQPCLLVDWSDVDTTKKLFLLRAAAAVGGRALTVYEAVYPRYQHPKDMQAFLDTLAQVLPTGCRPILVTDAGFRSPWFRRVEALGWGYVGRVRNRDYVRLAHQDLWFPAKSLYAQATQTPRALGELWIPRANPFFTRAYLYHRPTQGRHRLTARGKRRRNGPSEKHARGEREPWLLVSNLPLQRHTAKRVVALYRARMTIEQAFRDLKAYRHGFALRGNLGRRHDRIANLLLIAAFAILILWSIGLVGITRGLDRMLQANTERRKRVLSTFFIGGRLFKQGIVLRLAELNLALVDLRLTVLRNAAVTT